MRREIKHWPYDLLKDFEGVPAYFLHYLLDPSETEFLSIDEEPSSEKLDSLFKESHAAIIFFGHYHLPVDKLGCRRYVNPDSLGLHEAGAAKYALIDFKKGRFTVRHRRALYDKNSFFELFEKTRYPEERLCTKLSSVNIFPAEQTCRVQLLVISCGTPASQIYTTDSFRMRKMFLSS